MEAAGLRTPPHCLKSLAICDSRFESQIAIASESRDLDHLARTCLRCCFGRPSMRDLGSFLTISTAFTPFLMDFQSISVDFSHFPSFSVIFNHFWECQELTRSGLKGVSERGF